MQGPSHPLDHTHNAIAVGIPQQHGAITGGWTVEVENQRVSTMQAPAHQGQVGANGQLLCGWVHIAHLHGHCSKKKRLLIILTHGPGSFPSPSFHAGLFICSKTKVRFLPLQSCLSGRGLRVGKWDSCGQMGTFARLSSLQNLNRSVVPKCLLWAGMGAAAWSPRSCCCCAGRFFSLPGGCYNFRGSGEPPLQPS